MAEFVAVTNQRHAKAQSGKSAKETDHSALPKKNPDNLRDGRAESLHDSDLAPLLHRDRNQCAHDAKSRDHHDEEEEKEHDRALEPDGLKILMVHVNPGFGKLRRL